MIFLISWLFSVVTADVPVYVTYSAGTVKGFHVDYGPRVENQLYFGNGDVFLGIPYAQPPVNQLRLQKPQKICNLTTAPYDATYFRPWCPQVGIENISEDCLYLNVFSPNVNPVATYPVMLFIHGGTLKSGGASQFGTKGIIRNLVSHGVVVVTIQYRLGLLGFFTTLTDDFPPNLGMLDQVLSIQWVHDNIENFGGDPYRVTLFGESAGAASVSAHTYSPLSQNLFQGAIQESGGVLINFDGALGFSQTSQRRALQICGVAADQWGQKNFPGLKDCLMKADYNTWLPLDNDPVDEIGWKITQDNLFMPDLPRNLASRRPNIPMIIGSNQNEWSLVDLGLLASGVPATTYNKTNFEAFFGSMAGFLVNQDPRITQIMENVYAPPGTLPNDNLEWLKINDRVLTCTAFTGFIARDVQNWLINGNTNVYLYEFTYPSQVSRPPVQVPGWKPVFHTAELPFVFADEPSWTATLNENAVTSMDYEMLDWFSKTWTDFAKLGTPNMGNKWTPVSNAMQMNYYQIDADTPGMQRDYRRADIVVWNDVLPVLGGLWPPNRPMTGNSTAKLSEEFDKNSNCSYSFAIPTTTKTIPIGPTNPTPNNVKTTTILRKYPVTTKATNILGYSVNLMLLIISKHLL